MIKKHLNKKILIICITILIVFTIIIGIIIGKVLKHNISIITKTKYMFPNYIFNDPKHKFTIDQEIKYITDSFNFFIMYKYDNNGWFHTSSNNYVYCVLELIKTDIKLLKQDSISDFSWVFKFYKKPKPLAPINPSLTTYNVTNISCTNDFLNDVKKIIFDKYYWLPGK